MTPTTKPLQVIFEPTPEIYATDSQGSFSYALLHAGSESVETELYDEARFVVSIWAPSGQKGIDLDRTYVELRASLDPDEEHWIKLAEIEPVVPAYDTGRRFDGWIVLPILAARTAYSLAGSGFDPRIRIQIRASAYFVA
jgi:hypothetical protein